MTPLADRRASTTVLVAGAMPMLLALVALAVDLGMVQLESRRLQGIADASALSAAQDLAAAAARAQAMAARGGGGVTATAVTGRYVADPAIAPDARFTGGGTPPDAVAVTLLLDVPTPFAAVFGTRSVRVGRTAIATRLDLASLSIGSRLASIDGGVANAMLSALTGGSVSLSVLNYQALAGAEIDLLPFLDAVRVRAGVAPGSYDALLATEVSGNALLQAAADQVADPAARAALRTLATAARGTARLDRLFDLGAIGGQNGGGAGLVRVGAFELASNLLRATAATRQFALDLGTGVPGLAGTRVTVAIGEPVNTSPWIAITRSGEAMVRTAQARIYLETRVAPAALPGLSAVSAELPLFVELASAEARFDAIRCASPRSVDVLARPSPGLAAIAQVDRDLLSNFTVPIARRPADLLRTPLVKVTGSATIDLGAAEPFRKLVFTGDQIAAGTHQTIRSTALTSGVAASLLSGIDIDAQLLGFLPLPLTSIENALGGQLRSLSPVLDTLIAGLSDTLGVGLGEADVRVAGLRCGQPVLVG